ncbi:MAG: hypothetical protein PHH47_09590 [Gallionella sp.]|nr:hypothetical protein [Gallionella sp.]MDD4946637.1 hypothetical protein [Gallionella sp.]MDD5612599.1 hypothetical protein [Gallionella sp.]
MNSETNNTPSSEIATLEAEVRSVVEQGHDVQETVRQLTLRKISAHSLDIESLRQIAGAVLRGARAGAQKELNQTVNQNENARAQLRQAVAGLDVALAQLAEASKLAVEEASSRAQKFSSEDLSKTRADLEALESMFMETLQTTAASSKDVAGDILHDLAAHTRTHGSAVGAQIRETLSVISHQIGIAGRTQVAVGLHLAHATSDLLRQIAAGVLTGLADHVKPGQSRPAPTNTKEG